MQLGLCRSSLDCVLAIEGIQSSLIVSVHFIITYWCVWVEPPCDHGGCGGVSYCRSRMASLNLQEDSMHRLRQSFAAEMEKTTRNLTQQVAQGRCSVVCSHCSAVLLLVLTETVMSV